MFSLGLLSQLLFIVMMIFHFSKSLFCRWNMRLNIFCLEKKHTREVSQLKFSLQDTCQSLIKQHMPKKVRTKWKLVWSDSHDLHVFQFKVCSRPFEWCLSTGKCPCTFVSFSLLKGLNDVIIQGFDLINLATTLDSEIIIF